MADSRIARELKLTYQPVAVILTDEKPEGALQFAKGRWGCVIALLTAAAKGRTAVVDRETCGCTGGRVGLGFGEHEYDEMPGGIEYFLSTGAGEGYAEGEAYWKTPELAKAFLETLPMTDLPVTYVVFKPLSQVDLEKERPQSIVFYANPDQLSALIVLVNYGRAGGDNVAVEPGAGCHTIGIIPYREAEQERPRAVLGLFDISARPLVPADTMTFTVPFALWQEMEANVPGSFLEKESWAKVKARLPEPAK